DRVRRPFDVGRAPQQRPRIAYRLGPGRPISSARLHWQGSRRAMSRAPRGEGYYEIEVGGETRIVLAPPLTTMGEPFHDSKYRVFEPVGPGRRMMMGDDPRLPKMPERPTLLDFFRYRLAKPAVNHLLQSAALAQRSGQPEKIVLACLLHDIAVGGLFSGDHGYWGAQLVAPYL